MVSAEYTGKRILGWIFIYWYNYDAGGVVYQVTRVITILWGALIGNCVYMLVKYKKVI